MASCFTFLIGRELGGSGVSPEPSEPHCRFVLLSGGRTHPFTTLRSFSKRAKRVSMSDIRTNISEWFFSIKLRIS